MKKLIKIMFVSLLTAGIAFTMSSCNGTNSKDANGKDSTATKCTAKDSSKMACCKGGHECMKGCDKGCKTDSACMKNCGPECGKEGAMQCMKDHNCMKGCDKNCKSDSACMKTCGAKCRKSDASCSESGCMKGCDKGCKSKAECMKNCQRAFKLTLNFNKKGKLQFVELFLC